MEPQVDQLRDSDAANSQPMTIDLTSAFRTIDRTELGDQSDHFSGVKGQCV